MVCVPLMAKDLATSAAARKLASPACEAVMVQVPALWEVTVLPATVQTAPVLLVKLTARPDEALAVRSTLLPRVRSAG